MKKSLIEDNPYLKDASKRKEALARNVESSSAIEGIVVKRDAVTGRFERVPKDVTASEKSTKRS
jgi:hypothetical protein